MRIDVAYCFSDRQVVIELNMQVHCTAGQAIEQSGIIQHLADADKALAHIGIFGKKCTLDTPLAPNDRVEIYRPLLLSPTDARKLRAKTLSDKQNRAKANPIQVD